MKYVLNMHVFYFMQLSYALVLEHNIFYIAHTPSFVIIKKGETDDPKIELKIDFDDHKTLKYNY